MRRYIDFLNSLEDSQVEKNQNRNPTEKPVEQ